MKPRKKIIANKIKVQERIREKSINWTLSIDKKSKKSEYASLLFNKLELAHGSRGVHV